MFKGAPDTISVYQDDIFNHSKNVADHLKGMEFILDRLRQKGLVAKLKKCKFNYPQLQDLGHVIKARGRCPNPKHIEAVLDIAVTECAGDVLHILGLLNYNRDYIPSLASEAAVLSD